MTETIMECIKMGVKIREGGKGGRIEGREVGMAVEDIRGHLVDASVLLKSSSFLHKSGPSRPSDFLYFFLLLLFL